MSKRIRTKRRSKRRSKIRTIIRTKIRKKNSSKKSKAYKMNMSENNYRKLLSKRNLTKSQKKNLDRALHIKYCNCIKDLKYKENNPAAYGICANSVYKNRGIKIPPNAANKCKILN